MGVKFRKTILILASATILLASICYAETVAMFRADGYMDMYLINRSMGTTTVIDVSDRHYYHGCVRGGCRDRLDAVLPVNALIGDYDSDEQEDDY